MEMTPSQLDAEQKTYLEALKKLIEKFSSHLTEPASKQVLFLRNIQDLQKEFPVDPVSPSGLVEVLAKYMSLSTQIQNPRYMGHQVSYTHPASYLGDLLQSFTNNSLAVFDMGAPGLAIERNLIDWFLIKIGWGEHAGGILTHGGSLANLTGLLAARAVALPEVWKSGVGPGAVIFASETSHYCVTRAVSIMGFGQEALRLVPGRADGSMDPVSLEKMLDESLRKKEKIVAVSATAANTTTGAFDPLKDISEIVKSRGLWLHIDGAHGASALVSSKWKHLLSGLERADSVVWDAHKMMRVPSLCTALVFKDRKHMAKTFHQEAPYLSRAAAEDSPNGFPYTLECTRPAMGLKFYSTLLAMGDQGIAGYVDTCFDRARQIYGWLLEQSDFEVPVPPQSNILIFRLKDRDDEIQQRLYDRILAEGSFHITFAHFKGRAYLRLTLMNTLTTLEIFKELAGELRRLATVV
jgi:L-2,4-diaminobutyrate decarboxylase